MTGLIRRVLRLEVLCGLGIALLLPMTRMAAHAQDTTIPTQTTLLVDSSGMAGDSHTTATVSVDGADGHPASGVVNFADGRRQLAEAVLNESGQASAKLTLPAGAHALRAVYVGDATHQASVSETTEIKTQATNNSATGFQLSLTPISPATFPMVLTAGQSGSATVTVTPVNNASLTAPMFVTLSCSGLPTSASCTFSPANVEIQSTTPTSCTGSNCPPTSQMVISTEGPGNDSLYVPPAGPASPVSVALFLPAVFGLGGMAWGARRRRWLQRLILVALVGVVTTLGMTACNPYYYYYHHGPGATPATPTGTYTVTVTGQSTNGVTAVTGSTTMVLTVQ